MIHVCLTGAGAVLFSLYIVYDVNVIMKKVSPEEYILAAATLYLDIINLFVKLLELFGERKQKWRSWPTGLNSLVHHAT